MTDHKPVVGAAFEAAFGKFYATGTMASVKLPTKPAAEITMGGGARPSLGSVDFDLSWTYYLYPGETPGSPGINYWEALARADTKIGEALRVAGGFAYSPNYSNTGAWSKYVAFGVGIDLPRNVLPQNVTTDLLVRVRLVRCSLHCAEGMAQAYPQAKISLLAWGQRSFANAAKIERYVRLCPASYVARAAVRGSRN
jgi:hypothetical protein